MNSATIGCVFLQTYRAVVRNHTLHMAAALSYYLALSLFPAMILLSAIVAYLPVPNLLDHALDFIARVLPSDSTGLISRVLRDVVTPDPKFVLSFGILGTLWATSRGFAAAIEALSMAYDVRDDRPFWKTTLLALGLALTTGVLLVIALVVMVLGPRFGGWIAGMVHLSRFFVLLWPYARWTIAVGFAVMAIEILYFYAPNAKQRFRNTLPGAVCAIACWIVLSRILEEYFRHFASFNKTYGTLGAAIALMVWLYWTGFAILLGAELNAELERVNERKEAAR